MRAAIAARILAAIVLAVLLQIVVAALATAISTIVVARRGLPLPAPPIPYILTAVALGAAWCSLSAVWWARTALQSQVKTVMAVLGCLAAWGFVVRVHPRGAHSDAAAGWVASFALQAMLTVIAAFGIELAMKTSAAGFQKRFSLLFLFVWTTIVACFLAAARWVAGRYGWTSETFFADPFFVQLQAVAIANAALASAIFISLRGTPPLIKRLAICAIVVPAVSGAATGAMYLVFGSGFGASTLEYFWLMLTEGMFLVVTLLPLEIAMRRQSSGYQSSAATSNGSSSAAC
jgi:hypothetical protein